MNSKDDRDAFIVFLKTHALRNEEQLKHFNNLKKVISFIIINELVFFAYQERKICAYGCWFASIINVFINNRQQMRSLSVKQQPTVNFSYRSSPTKITSNKYIFNHAQPDIIINTKPINNQSLIDRHILAQQRSHIKIVQPREEQIRKERRHKIFQDTSLNRLSKSKQRNKSYTIFNGIPHESTNKIKDMVFTKQSGKQQSVQTDLINPKQPQNRISTFNPSPPKRPISPQKHYLLQSPLQIQEINHQSVSLQHFNGANSLRLQQELSQKEREVKFLKLELERYERCNKLTLENQFIYKKLVERLDQINHSQYLKENSQGIIQNKNKVDSKSPQSERIPQHFSQTTRFLYPSSQKKYSNKHKSIGTILSQVQPIKNIFQQSPPKPSNSDQVKTITFQKTHHNKIVKNQHHRYPSPFRQQNESFTSKRAEYARQLSNTIDLDNPPVYDRLSQMNRHLQGKVILRNVLKPYQTKHPSIDRERVVSAYSIMRWDGALKYLV